MVEGPKRSEEINTEAEAIPPLFYMKYLAFFFTAFIILIVILADRGQLGPIGRIYDFPYGDKAGHFVLFGLLNFFLTAAFIRAFPSRDPKRIALAIGLILILLIAAEEYSQQYFAHRTYDMLDLTASYIGLIVGGMIAYRLKE